MQKFLLYFKRAVDAIFKAAKTIIIELFLKVGTEEDVDVVFKQLKRNCRNYVFKSGVNFLNTKVQKPKSAWTKFKESLPFSKKNKKPAPLDMLLGGVLDLTEDMMLNHGNPI